MAVLRLLRGFLGWDEFQRGLQVCKNCLLLISWNIPVDKNNKRFSAILPQTEHVWWIKKEKFLWVFETTTIVFLLCLWDLWQLTNLFHLKNTKTLGTWEKIFVLRLSTHQSTTSFYFSFVKLTSYPYYSFQMYISKYKFKNAKMSELWSTFKEVN